LSFFEELKRRNVFCVGRAYVISTWIIKIIAGAIAMVSKLSLKFTIYVYKLSELVKGNKGTIS